MQGLMAQTDGDATTTSYGQHIDVASCERLLRCQIFISLFRRGMAEINARRRRRQEAVPGFISFIFENFYSRTRDMHVRLSLSRAPR
jgi:hypothetical protein